MKDFMARSWGRIPREKFDMVGRFQNQPRKVTGSRQPRTRDILTCQNLSLLPKFLSTLIEGTRLENMELCSVCSQLDLSPWPYEAHTLGLYDELLLKSNTLGPGLGGCGGCAFFAEILQTSDCWRNRMSGLRGLSIFFDKTQGLGTRAFSGPIVYAFGDLNLEICTKTDTTGVFYRK
jgi:hypothetical protein